VGVVRRCRYIQSNVHEVAIQFKSTVDPAVFCHDAVRIRVLLAEHDAALARLAMLHLGRLNCEVETATDGNQTVELALRTCFDVVLMNMELPRPDGFVVARQLRERGFSGLIVGCSGSDAAEDRKRCLESGCDQHMARPFSFEQLVACVATLQCAPLFSTFHDDPVMADLVSEFVTGIVAKTRGLEEALTARDHSALARMAVNLKSEGRAFGFEMIAEAASAVEESARRGDSHETIARLVRGLIRLCGQARAAAKQPNVKTGRVESPPNSVA
jgi:DNA-binding response OmpR family regulator